VKGSFPISVPLALLAWAASAVAVEPQGGEAKPAPKPATARMVYYSGQVQGVGFRATAAEIARGYPVTGWVKNLLDGRVQLLVEGPEQAVEAFLKAVRSRWPKNIRKEQIEKPPATGKYKTFEVVQ